MHMNSLYEQTPALPANWEIADDGSIHYRIDLNDNYRTISNDCTAAPDTRNGNPTENDTVHRSTPTIRKILMVFLMTSITVLVFCIFDAIKWHITMEPNGYKEYSDEIHLTSSHWPNEYSFVGTLESGETDEYIIVTESDYLTMAFKTHTSDNHGVDIKIIREDGSYMVFNSSNSNQIFFVGDHVELPQKGTYRVRISSAYYVDYVVTLDGYVSLNKGD